MTACWTPKGERMPRAKQAGVRFARRFVLLVPLGMALAGMSVGTAERPTRPDRPAPGSGRHRNGRAPAGCGRRQMMKLPEEQRVFS